MRQRNGQRALVPRGPGAGPGAQYVPSKCNIDDIDVKTVGQVLGQNLEDWTLLFVFVKDAASFQPPNGNNCAAFVPRRKIAIPCGRVIRVK